MKHSSQVRHTSFTNSISALFSGDLDPLFTISGGSSGPIGTV